MDWLKENASIISKVWNFELFSVENSPISVANLIVGFFLLAGGFWLSKRFTRAVLVRLIRRLDLTLDQQSTISSLVFYVLVLLTTFFAMNVAGVPLTVFTFFGGAVAIGIGFGSQNLVNNFMSGLILMMEKPVKVGDMVEMDSLRGVVEHIGARSTRIRSYKNTHIIVPNSSFLEKNVLNWTLTDDIVRIGVSVGVAYGSPTSDVKDLLLEAVKAEQEVLENPEPFVIFKEFGDNALLFEVVFGVKIKNHMERMRIESNIRFTIDRLFAAARITIAFPQRDVHLFTPEAIKVDIGRDSAPHSRV